MTFVVNSIDPNNRPGGRNLIVTAKTANKVQFFDARTLAPTGEIDMPASTHEMILSLDGTKVFASVYGGGVFRKNTNPDRRIAVIDLAAKSLERLIDLGANVAPHGLMMDRAGTLWATGELGNKLLAVDPVSSAVEAVELGGSPHWCAVSHATGKVFASLKATDTVIAVDLARRKPIDRIAIPNLAEGLAVAPDGETLYVVAHQKGELHVIDSRSHRLRVTVAVEGLRSAGNQLRRVRVSPDGKYVLMSSTFDRHAAIFQADNLKQIGSIETAKSPMGFGFAPDGKHAYLCCHDDALVLELELTTGRLTRRFATAAGCEFIIAYQCPAL
jgi:DNA-binding beta-propeller fold protein YncE